MVTIDDTALVFEGGGMRNAYTAALVSRLIAEGINFPHISGVSAGSSHLCNFTSRDAIRSHATFVDLVEDHVVIKDEAECGAEHESDDVDGDVVGERGGESEDVVGEQEAEL